MLNTQCWISCRFCTRRKGVIRNGCTSKLMRDRRIVPELGPRRQIRRNFVPLQSDEPFRRNWHLLLRLKDDVGQPMIFHPSKVFNWTIYEVNFEYHSQSIIYIFYIYFYTCRNLFVRLDVKKMEIRLDNSYCIWDRRLGYVDLIWISNFIFCAIYLWTKYLLYLKSTYIILEKVHKVKYS